MCVYVCMNKHLRVRIILFLEEIDGSVSQFIHWIIGFFRQQLGSSRNCSLITNLIAFCSLIFPIPVLCSNTYRAPKKFCLGSGFLGWFSLTWKTPETFFELKVYHTWTKTELISLTPSWKIIDLIFHSFRNTISSHRTMKILLFDLNFTAHEEK